MLWTDPKSPRIWRDSFNHEGKGEVLAAAAHYSDEVLARIAEEGFTGIWFFCLLHELMRSSVFPELNQPLADERLASLQTVIDRARKHGIGVYLYFNDPVGLDVDHPFWKSHPDLKGVTLWHMFSLCTSTPQVQAFFRDAVESVFRRVHDVAGVILITACESLTHCWSKCNTRKGSPPPTCPRCREREPAELVLELLRVWSDVRRQQARPFRLMAWNWEWSYWYPDPQAEITLRLPEGTELLLDMEIGATRPWHGRTNYLGEYSLGYVGPSQRFIATQDAVAGQHVPIHAKLQLNNTHEMCSVPNLPVLRTLHGKFKALYERQVAGFMGTWTMGTTFTLNTYSLRLFLHDPARFSDERGFLGQLAREYLGIEKPEPAVRAWGAFSEAFTHYPFTVQMLYIGPHNDAPARRLSLHYEGKPTGRSWMPDETGDDLGPCLQANKVELESFTLDDVIDGFTRMRDRWEAGLADYAPALETPGERATDGQRRHCREELGCARMIGIQIRSIVNVFRFYREQMRVIRECGLTPPCDLPPDPALLAIMREEIANVEHALPLVEADRRLGFHPDVQGYKYDARLIRDKLAAMQAELARAGQ